MPGSPLLEKTVAVVLAGGFGTRVRHLLPDIPKPMAPVAGRPFLEWVVRYLARQGLTKVALSTGHLSEVIERHFATNPVPGVTTWCGREADPLGTGGGFLNAAQICGQTPPAWLVLNGDSLVFADLAVAAAALERPEIGGAVVGCEVEDSARYGTLVRGPGGKLLGFQEKRPGRGIINAGIYLFRDALLAKFPERRPLSFETEVFPALLQAGAAIQVCPVTAPFLDIGTPESLRQAEEFIRQNQAEFVRG
jgi:NDP-sugar pyrophosphorylase family protein